jgi:hypothetical protein
MINVDAPEELISNCPVLHHMAEYESWPRIRQIGLRTMGKFVESFNPDSVTCDALVR